MKRRRKLTRDEMRDFLMGPVDEKLFMKAVRQSSAAALREAVVFWYRGTWEETRERVRYEEALLSAQKIIAKAMTGTR